MPAGDYLGGLALFLVVAACAAAASGLALRSRAAGVSGVPRALALALLFIAAVLAAHLLPGVLGILGRGSVVATAAALLVVAWGTRARGGSARATSAAPSPTPGPEPSDLLGRTTALIAVGLVTWLVLAAMVELAPVPPTNLDALNFQLPGIGAWIQGGGFWQVSQWVPDLAHGNYPQNGELLDLAVMLPWHNDAFVRLVTVPLLAMAALAVYAISVELGATRASAALWAAAFAVMPAVLHPAAIKVLSDTLMLASLGTGVLFLLRHARTEERADLVLAGAGFGIAFGSKWYGVSSVVAVLAVWAVASLACRTSPRIVGRRLLTLAGLVAAGGGFWLLRNWVESGNPVFPVKVELFGLTVFDAPFDRARAEAGFTIASYLDDPAVLGDYIVPALERTVALPGLVIGLSSVAALVIGLTRRGRAADPRIAAMAAASLILAAVYCVTPYSALGGEGEPLLAEFNVRYLAPALLVGAPLAAWLPVRLPGLRRLWPVLGVAATAQAAGFTADDLGRTPLVQAALALLAAAGLATLAWILVRRGAVRRPSRGLTAVAAAAAALLAVLAGDGLQSRVNDRRYADADPAFAWAGERAPAGAKIGLAGAWGIARESPVWPTFGPRFENEVLYVGPFRDGMLRDYRDRAGFLAGLRDSRVGHLLVARGEPPRPVVRQERWARSAGLRSVLRTPRFTLFRVPGG